MNLLITPEGWQQVTDDRIVELGRDIFPCGQCSTSTKKVYHNLMGNHRHVASEVLAKLGDEDENESETDHVAEFMATVRKAFEAIPDDADLEAYREALLLLAAEL